MARISSPGTGKRQSITTGSRFTPRPWRAWRRASARLLLTHTSPTTRMVGKVVSVGVAALPLSSRVRSPEQGPGAACLRGLLSSRDSGGGGGTFLWLTATVRAPWRLLLAAGRGVSTRASGGLVPPHVHHLLLRCLQRGLSCSARGSSLGGQGQGLPGPALLPLHEAQDVRPLRAAPALARSRLCHWALINFIP